MELGHRSSKGGTAGVGGGSHHGLAGMAVGGAAAAAASSGSLCAPLPADFGTRSSHDFQ